MEAKAEKRLALNTTAFGALHVVFESGPALMPAGHTQQQQLRFQPRAPQSREFIEPSVVEALLSSVQRINWAK